MGLASSGLHANGYSLVRKLVAEHRLDLAAPYGGVACAALGCSPSGFELIAEPGLVDATLGDVLLTPTRVYARDLLAIRESLEAAGSEVHGIAHITGGGLPGNVPRALPGAARGAARPVGVADAVGHARPGRARRDRGRGAAGDVQRRASAWCSSCPPACAHRAVALAAERGIAAWVVGEVVEAATIGGRYQEGEVER